MPVDDLAGAGLLAALLVLALALLFLRAEALAVPTPERPTVVGPNAARSE